MTIDLTQIKKLTLSNPTAPGRPAFLSAASGLVKLDGHFYVVADDELSLGIFSTTDDKPGTLHPLFPGRLPANDAERKKHKPDLEALTYLSAGYFPPFGALLAAPSGSKANRFTGALIPFQKNGDLSPTPQLVDFGPLYTKLLTSLPDLNIEGAVIFDGRLKLFQRGNGPSKQNAVIDVHLEGVLEDLKNRGALSDRHIKNTEFFDLGELHGVALSFTDAAVYLDKEIWFLAVAENTESTYSDGEYLGAVIGQLMNDGSLGKMHDLKCPHKPEGLCFSNDLSRREFFVVTDADRSSTPAVLYRGVVE